MTALPVFSALSLCVILITCSLISEWSLCMVTEPVTVRKKIPWNTLSGKAPLLLGHRGEPFYVPEETVASFKLAAVEGADFVEPDIVLTKDGIPVCFHDLALKSNTDIAQHPEFAHLRGNYTVISQGKNQLLENDWLVVNLTLNELKTLRINQQKKGIRIQDFNGDFPIATFEEYLRTIHAASLRLNKSIGIVPELKNTKFHNQIFNEVEHYMEKTLLNTLKKFGYPLTVGDSENCQAADADEPFRDLDNEIPVPVKCGPVIIQSFEKDSLQYISKLLHPRNIELLMLIDTEVELMTPGGFNNMREYSDYLGLWKEYIFTGIEADIKYRDLPYNATEVLSLGGFLQPHQVISLAHSLGLKVSLYTLPDSREDSMWGCAVKCLPRNRKKELFYFLGTGADGLFVENIPQAKYVRMQFEYELLLQKAYAKFDGNSIGGERRRRTDS